MSNKPSPSNESVIDIAKDSRPQHKDEHQLDQSTISIDSRNSFNDDESEMSITLDSTHDFSMDGAIFSDDKVDELVESFWTKFDKKIEKAVILQQEAQKNREQTIQNEIQEEEKKRQLAIEKHSEYFNFSYSFIFIIEFLLRIWILLKTKTSHRAKEFKNFICSISWRDNLVFYSFHRHTNFLVLLLTITDLIIETLIILDDFDYIDGRGNEMLFLIFQRVCIAIMFCFIIEVFLKLLSVGQDILQDKLEVFDVVLVLFYFCSELIATQAFRNLDGDYPKYLHVVVVLRLWRIALVINETCVIEESTSEHCKTLE